MTEMPDDTCATATNFPYTSGAMGPDTAAPTMSRRERKVAETRASILAAAQRLITEHGFEETTIERIAEEADVAPRTFFRYFPTKEAVLFAELDSARSDLVTALEQRPVDEPVLESIAIVLHDFAEQIDDRWHEFSWVREVTDAYRLDRSADRMAAGHLINARVADVISTRLGVDQTADARPGAWAKAIMATFGQTVMLGPDASPTGRTFDLFINTLESTAEALKQVSSVAQGIHQNHG